MTVAEINCSKKILLFLLSFLCDFEEKVPVESWKLCMRKWTEGKCFPFFNKRKTLSFRKVTFFNLTGIQFPLTIFLYCCQTWEKQESEFQEFTFLQSNTAMVCNYCRMKGHIKKHDRKLKKKKYKKSLQRIILLPKH